MLGNDPLAASAAVAVECHAIADPEVIDAQADDDDGAEDTAPPVLTTSLVVCKESIASRLRAYLPEHAQSPVNVTWYVCRRCCPCVC